jgi:NAD(P)-dependent dehydrogenase (short-subunit alcohol dehydrogenase family)
MPAVLIIGATRGLGAALANTYAADAENVVFGTTRAAAGPPHKADEDGRKITWVPGVDLMSPGCGAALVHQCVLLGVSPPKAMVAEGGVRGFDVVVRTVFLPIFIYSGVQALGNWGRGLRNGGIVRGGLTDERRADYHGRVFRDGGLRDGAEVG